jgi:hypothetical protein
MSSAGQLPTLWDPEQLFSHLALWAGVPAVAVAVVVALLGLYQSAKGWAGLTGSAVRGYQTAAQKIEEMTSERQRAAGRLAVWSVLAVGFSYMLAVIVDALVQTAETDGANALMSSTVVEHSVVATQWSPAAVWTMIIGVAGIGLLGIACIADLTGLRKLISFLGGLACTVAWVGGAGMGIDALIGFAIRGLGSQNPPPISLLVTQVTTALLLLALGLLLPKIRRASGIAFSAG